MNNFKKVAVFSLLAAFIFASCKREISTINYEGGTAPTLTATEVANVEFANADQTALILKWTNPNYQFTTGASSQDVNYKIIIDTAGSNFSHPYQLSVSKDLSYTFTVSQMNDIMQNQMNLLPAMAHVLQMKVIAALANNSLALSSDSIQYTATPYIVPPKVQPPASGNLYIVGDATPGGWPPLTNDPSTEKFEQLSATHYQLTIALNADKEYKFVETPGEWDQQWSVKDEQASGDAATFGTDLVFNGANCRAPQTSGTYLIDIDFQKGKFSLTKK